MNNIKIGNVYKHFKGNLYKVIDIVYDCEYGDEEHKVVIYEALYDDHKHWARKYDDFASLVDKEKYPDVSQKFRFELVEHNL